MDNLTRQLRDDASQIKADISPELDARIRASLEAAEPVRAESPAPAPRTTSMWWWSSLVGATSAIAVIVLLNMGGQPRVPVPPDSGVPTLAPSLNIEPAVLTGPLEAELENLESDLRKAEEALRADIGLDPRVEDSADGS